MASLRALKPLKDGHHEVRKISSLSSFGPEALDLLCMSGWWKKPAYLMVARKQKQRTGRGGWLNIPSPPPATNQFLEVPALINFRVRDIPDTNCTHGNLYRG